MRPVSPTVPTDEERLSQLARRFRGTRRDDERRKIAGEYAESVERLIKTGRWDEMPPPEDQLPDTWMPRTFSDFWSNPESVSSESTAAPASVLDQFDRTPVACRADMPGDGSLLKAGEIKRSATAISCSAASAAPTIWASYSYAKDWFADALNESRTVSDHRARRREIVFAVCFAEAYLVEWVRDDVLNRDFERLNGFFPPGENLGILEKWKKIVKSLESDGVIRHPVDFGKPFWNDFAKLVKMRNGLIHARSSRPETIGQPDDERPFPSMGDMNNLHAGWSVAVVVKLVNELHAASGTSVPAWIDPQAVS